MQLLAWQRNELFQELLKIGLYPNDFVVKNDDSWYSVKLKANVRISFSIRLINDKDKEKGEYIVSRMPGTEYTPNKSEWSSAASWNSHMHDSCIDYFKIWATAVKCEVDAPDLWLETTKAVQLFTAADTPAADRFTVAELGAVQGQLRMLGSSFSTSELPEEAKSRLAELTQTATLKAEVLTKKDWQNWIIGAFTSAIASLGLEEEQIQEVMALVRLAFGGLFLK